MQTLLSLCCSQQSEGPRRRARSDRWGDCWCSAWTFIFVQVFQQKKSNWMITFNVITHRCISWVHKINMVIRQLSLPSCSSLPTCIQNRARHFYHTWHANASNWPLYLYGACSSRTQAGRMKMMRRMNLQAGSLQRPLTTAGIHQQLAFIFNSE